MAPTTPTNEPTSPRPLVVFLHGLGASGQLLLRTLKLSSLAGSHEMLLAAPDGRIDSQGRRFWNGTDACCDFDNTGSADAAFISSLLDDVQSKHSVASRRVFVVGYSNGAFMAHRVACDLSDRIAGIATFSGAGWAAPNRCRPSSDVTVLHVHGDADEVVAFEGGPLPGRFNGPHQPGAPATTRAWARRNRCDPTATTATRGHAISGRPVTRRAYGSCPGAAVELWTVHGGGHLIGMGSGDITAALDMLMSHPKELRDDRPTREP